MKHTYSYRTIIDEDENKTYHGWVPKLPGCHTWGESIEETKNNLQDAIKAYVASLIEDNEPVPEEDGLEFVQTIYLEDIIPQKTATQPAYA